MFTYNGTAVLQFDSPVTGNAGSGVTVTVRGASTPVAGLGGLANIYDFNESAIPNPLTTDSKGNYTFKALNGTYDIILSEGDPTEVILPSQQFVDLTEVSIGVAQEVQTLADGQTVITFTSQTTTSAEFHINGQGVDSRLLTSQDINGALTTTTSITLFDSYPGGSIVTLSKNTDAGNTVAGIVIPTVEEEVVLTNGQLVVAFSTLTTEYSEFHINGIGVDSRLLTSDDINHSLTTPSTITLFESYPAGSIVTLAQNSTKGNISVDITNNIIKDLSQAYEFDTLQHAIVSTVVLPVGKVLNLKERSTGNGGGATWDVVLASSVTENGYNIVQCTGVPTLSLVLRVGSELNIKQFGAIGSGLVLDTLAIQATIDYAKTVLGSVMVYFPSGTYLIDTPLILPRTGSTPNNVVLLNGATERGVRLVGDSSFASGRSVIEWEQTNERAWLQSITNMTIVPAEVEGCGGIHFKRSVPYTTLAEIYEERLQIALDKITVEGSNEFNPHLIKLEGNLIACDWGFISFDPKLGANPVYKDSIGFDLDTEDFGAVSNDAGGLGYSSVKQINTSPRRGGYCTAIKGRLNRVGISELLGGNGTFIQPCLDLTNSFGGNLNNIFNEGKGGQPQYRFTGCVNMIFNGIQLGSPQDQGGGKGNAIELISCLGMKFNDLQRSVGSTSYSGIGKFAIKCDVNTKNCSFNGMLSGVNASTFKNEISDLGFMNSFEFTIPSLNDGLLYQAGFLGKSLLVGAWHTENLPETDSNVRMNRGYPTTVTNLLWDRYAVTRDAYITDIAVTISTPVTAGTLTVVLTNDGIDIAGTAIVIDNASIGQIQTVVIETGKRKVVAGSGLQMRAYTSGLAPLTIDVVADFTLQY